MKHEIVNDPRLEHAALSSRGTCAICASKVAPLSGSRISRSVVNATAEISERYTSRWRIYEPVKKHYVKA
jgi:hypothetical protein